MALVWDVLTSLPRNIVVLLVAVLGVLIYTAWSGWWYVFWGIVVLVVAGLGALAYLLYRGAKRISAEATGTIPAPAFSHMIGHPEAMIHPCKHIYRGGLCDQIGKQSAFHQLVLTKRFIVFCNDATEAGRIITDLPTKGAVYSMFRLRPDVPDVMSAEGADYDARVKVLQRGLANLSLGKRNISADLLTKLKTASEAGKPVDLAKLLKLAALDAVAGCAFNYDLGAVTGSEDGEAILSAMNTRDDKIKSVGMFAHPSNRKVPVEEEMEAAKRWHGFVRKLQGFVVSEVLAEESASGELNPDKFTHSLVLLARELHRAKGASGELDLTTDPNIAAEIHSTLRHGFEAIAGTLSWIFYLLYKFPHTRAKLETALLVGDAAKNAGPDTEYLDWVVREAMRRNPVMGNFTQRVVNKDGYRVKGPNGGHVVPVQAADGGTPINVSIFSLQNTVNTWGENPTEFLPERWQGPGSKEEGIKASHPSCPFLAANPGSAAALRNPHYAGTGFKDNSLSFFPFSAGERICKGRDFALDVMRRIVFDVCSVYRLDCSSAEELPEDPGASYFSSIVPVLVPGVLVVLATRITDPGVAPTKKKKPEHGWAKDDSDDEADKE